MNNWDLHCKSHLEVSLFSMLFYVGYTLGNIIMNPLSDKFGRKSIFLLCIFMNMSMVFIQILIPEGPTHQNMVPIVYATMFINGFFTAARFAVGFTYFAELIPSKYIDIVTSLTNCNEAMTYIFLTIYYWKVSDSDEWRWSVSPCLISGGISFIIIFLWFPESPKWKYGQRKYRSCIETLTFMAKQNGVRLRPDNPLMATHVYDIYRESDESD